MHITILALGSRGDIQPYVILGHGLITAGHRVRLISFENFAGLAAENGLDFHPIHGNAQALVAQAGAEMVALVRSFGALAQGYARDLSAPHLGKTDLILNQLPAGLYGFDLAEKYALPMALTAVMPLARTRAFPLMGFPHLPLPGYNRATYFLGEQMAWQMFRSVINHWRKHILALAPLPLGGAFKQFGTRRIPILNGFSPLVVPPPADWGEHIHTTGYWFPAAKAWQPPADLQKFIEAGSPPVFIGFGSMPVKNPEQTAKTILAALRAAGQRGILQAGWGGLYNFELPESVFKIDEVPYEWLFPRMGMLVHHGGSGTSAFGLRAGIPACVVPFVFDQFFWGKRISDLGAGPKPIPFNQLSVDRLSAAIHQGIQDAGLRRKAADLGQRIRAEEGIANATQIVEQMSPVFSTMK